MIRTEHRDYREITHHSFDRMLSTNSTFDAYPGIIAGIRDEIEKFDTNRPPFAKCRYKVRRDRKHLFPGEACPRDVLGVQITTGRINNRVVSREFYLVIDEDRFHEFRPASGHYKLTPENETA